MTHENNALLNRIAPGASNDYNMEMMRMGGYYPGQHSQGILPSISVNDKGLAYSNSK